MRPISKKISFVMIESSDVDCLAMKKISRSKWGQDGIGKYLLLTVALLKEENGLFDPTDLDICESLSFECALEPAEFREFIQFLIDKSLLVKDEETDLYSTTLLNRSRNSIEFSREYDRKRKEERKKVFQPENSGKSRKTTENEVFQPENPIIHPEKPVFRSFPEFSNTEQNRTEQNRTEKKRTEQNAHAREQKNVAVSLALFSTEQKIAVEKLAKYISNPDTLEKFALKVPLAAIDDGLEVLERRLKLPKGTPNHVANAGGFLVDRFNRLLDKSNGNGAKK